MKNPRAIDGALVDAYLARRALDYLVGFTLSPVLWRKLPGARSAGRVQSVALRLVCDRELEIEKFVAREYWSLVATLATPRNETFEARLVGADGKKIQRLDIGTGAEAEQFKRDLETAQFTVASVEAKPGKRNPPPPFTTSTMQQEASRKLGFAPAHTMRVAQRLYEGIDIGGETVGLITYMRTDGVYIDGEAITAMRSAIASNYGKQYVPEAPRAYQTKQKTAQEAHEAVRPTDVTRRPRDVAKYLDSDQARLYELIWLRAIASQMESAELERTTVDIAGQGRRAQSRSARDRHGHQVRRLPHALSGRRGRRAGGRREQAPAAMSAGEALAKRAIAATQHFTEPPPRYSEASLVKRMEELGIGRPSTYASILQVLKDRNYVRLEKKRLYAEDKGRVVVAFLENFFARYVEYDFTAGLEEDLDRIANKRDRLARGAARLLARLHRRGRQHQGRAASAKCSTCSTRCSRRICSRRARTAPTRASARPAATAGSALKLGKFGAFIGCSNYPECNFTRQLAANGAASADKVLGKDPETGLDVAIKTGRFGTYLQLGEGSKEEKPKRAGIPKGRRPTTSRSKCALKLLSLPREVGKNPEDGEPIMAGIGRFGPYVQHGKTYANLDSGEDVLTIGLNRAVTLIAEKRANPGKGRRFGGDPGRSLGDHPQRGGRSWSRRAATALT